INDYHTRLTSDRKKSTINSDSKSPNTIVNTCQITQYNSECCTDKNLQQHNNACLIFLWYPCFSWFLLFLIYYGCRGFLISPCFNGCLHIHRMAPEEIGCQWHTKELLCCDH